MGSPSRANAAKAKARMAARERRKKGNRLAGLKANAGTARRRGSRRRKMQPDLASSRCDKSCTPVGVNALTATDGGNQLPT